jgi:hypothetical protein
MGIKVKSIDSKSSLRKFSVNVFGGTASNNTIYTQIPVACKFDKAVFGRAVDSAACIVGISNVSISAAIFGAATTVASASGLAGSVVSLSATADTFISANSLLKITLSATTTDGALSLIFSIDENKEN